MATDAQTLSTDTLGHRVGELTNRVAQIETNFDKLNTKIDANQSLVLGAIKEIATRNEATKEEITKSQLERGKTNWTLILGILGLVFTAGATLWGGAYALFGGRIDDNRLRLDRLAEKVDKIDSKFVPAADIDQRMNDLKQSLRDLRDVAVTRQEIASAADKRDVISKTIIDRIERLEAQTSKLADSIVPRGEHSAIREQDRDRWAVIQRADADALAGMQRQVDEIRTELRDLGRRMNTRLGG